MRDFNKAASEDVGFKFEESSWGTAMEGYAESAAKLRNKSFANIVASAKEIAKKTHRGTSRSSRSAASTSRVKALKDHRAMLVDISEDDD